MGGKNLEELKNAATRFESVPKSDKANKEAGDLERAAKDQIEKLKKYDRMNK